MASTQRTLVSLDAASAVGALYGAIPSGALSYPKLGKTIVFDGAKLHGAVPLDSASAPTGLTRVTFLVNARAVARPCTLCPAAHDHALLRAVHAVLSQSICLVRGRCGSAIDRTLWRRFRRGSQRQ